MVFISLKFIEQIFHSTQLLGGFDCSSTSCVVIVIIFIRYLRVYSCGDNYLCMIELQLVDMETCIYDVL